MKDQVINAIDDFYKTCPQGVEMSILKLMEMLNLDYYNMSDRALIDGILRQLQSERFIVCTLPADNVLYRFKKC